MLNFGYRFGQPETWIAPGGGTLRRQRTEATGFDGQAGFTTPAYSVPAAASPRPKPRPAPNRTSSTSTATACQILVFKALADDITSGGIAIQVALNTGAGFLPAQPWNGALPVPDPEPQRRLPQPRPALHHHDPDRRDGVVSRHQPRPQRGQQLRRIARPDPATSTATAMPTTSPLTARVVTVHLNQRGRTNLLEEHHPAPGCDHRARLCARRQHARHAAEPLGDGLAHGVRRPRRRRRRAPRRPIIRSQPSTTRTGAGTAPSASSTASPR